MTDLASFAEQDVIDVWGTNCYCPLTGSIQLDLHHCLGRGGKRNRKVHSSILGSFPLCREIHAGGCVNHHYFLLFLLDYTFRKVMQSSYQFVDLDYEFIDMARKKGFGEIYTSLKT